MFFNNIVEITALDIYKAVKELGVMPGDTVLVHSSLKSVGYVAGGPASVIQGFEEVLGKEGTLVLPTICQVDFKNSYKSWYRDKPSDVGFITEYFRKQPYVYRSDQATHSVAARGKRAYELTWEHTSYGPHLCPFGEFAFADSSPWMKMYRSDVKVVFLGVEMDCNTMKHMVESRYTEHLLAGVRGESEREALESRLETFEREGVWLYYDGIEAQKALDAMGLIRRATCGKADLMLVRSKDASDAAFKLLEENPERWYEKESLEWVMDCLESAK